MSTSKTPAGSQGGANNGLLALGLIALIFGAGFASGWFVHRTSPRQVTGPGTTYKRGKRKRKPWRKRFVGRLSRKLSLDQKQAAAIETIIGKHQPKYRQIKRSIRPALQQVRVQMRSEIKAILKPPQLQRFEQMLKASKARRAARRKRRARKK